MCMVRIDGVGRWDYALGYSLTCITSAIHVFHQGRVSSNFSGGGKLHRGAKL